MYMKKSHLPKSWTTVTPTSKALAMLAFCAAAVMFFWLGMAYQVGLTPICR